MQFIYSEEQTELERLIGGYRHINAFGKIVTGDADRLVDVLEKCGVPPQTTVYIDSTGGDLEEGIKIGCVIRAYNLETSIGTYTLEPPQGDVPMAARTLTPGVCFSAATMAFAGGRLRHYPRGSRFGVHRFVFAQPGPANMERSQELSASMAKFLEQMGVSLMFLQASAGVPNDKLFEMDEDALREHGVVTGGQTDVEWGTEMRNNMMYVRGTRDSIFGKHKVMLAHAKDAGFMFFAVIEAQGRQQELCDFGLVEIVVNGEDHRIDISERCERLPNDVDVVLMSKISNEEAALIAYSKSFGVQIRFSPEAELFLGVSALDTTGGEDSLITLYKNMS